MLVKDAMTPQTKVLDSETSAEDAIRIMEDLQVDLLPVGTKKGLIGVLAASDITLRVIAKGLNPAETPVRNVMNLGLPACNENQAMEQAIDIMRKRNTNAVVVLDDNRRPVGVVALKANE